MTIYTPGAYAKVLRASAVKIVPETRGVVKKAAQNVKVEARKIVATSHSNSGKRNAGHYINYDLIGMASAEIGYDKPAGSLGTMNEYGSANNSPDGALAKSLDKEAPELEKWLAKVVEDII